MQQSNPQSINMSSFNIVVLAGAYSLLAVPSFADPLCRRWRRPRGEPNVTNLLTRDERELTRSLLDCRRGNQGMITPIEQNAPRPNAYRFSKSSRRPPTSLSISRSTFSAAYVLNPAHAWLCHGTDRSSAR